MLRTSVALLLVLALFASCQQKSSPPPSGPQGGASAIPPGTGDQAPFKVKFETSCGDIVLLVHPEWAPLGAARFKELVKIGFYDGCRFFRVAVDPRPFVVQFGINGDPTLDSRWAEFAIQDDPVKMTNRKGTLVFATSGPNSRTTQLFFNLGDNSRLDPRGFAPFAEVIEGWETVEKINPKHGEDPSGNQGRIHAEGNAYLDRDFPGLDYIRKATIL